MQPQRPQKPQLFDTPPSRRPTAAQPPDIFTALPPRIRHSTDATANRAFDNSDIVESGSPTYSKNHPESSKRPWGSVDQAYTTLNDDQAPAYLPGDSRYPHPSMPEPAAGSNPYPSGSGPGLFRHPTTRSRSNSFSYPNDASAPAANQQNGWFSSINRTVKNNVPSIFSSEADDEFAEFRDYKNPADAESTFTLDPATGRRTRKTTVVSEDEGSDAETVYETDVESICSTEPDEDFDENDLEPDDPRSRQKITYDKKGHKIIVKDEHIRKHTSTELNSKRCITTMGKALLQFGAPTHRNEAILTSLSTTLGVKAHFVQFPGVIIASFDPPHHSRDSLKRPRRGKNGKVKMGFTAEEAEAAAAATAHEGVGSTTRFIKSAGGLDLGKVHATYQIYRRLMLDKISTVEAYEKIEGLLNAPPKYGIKAKTFFAFGCGAAICGLSFGGSFADMWVAGVLSCMMMFINAKYAKENPIMANIFELVMAVIVSLIARGLSFVNQGELFCYQSIASGGVVLILPGFLILLSSLDLANKHMLTGSIKLVYTITYTLFLAFCLTLGSDLFFALSPSARTAQNAATAALSATETLNGSFSASSLAPASNTSAVPYNAFNAAFTFPDDNAIDTYNAKVINGCFRNDTWPWYAQVLPSWVTYILVPIFSILISLNNNQPMKSWHFPTMVIISIASYWANKFANHYAFTHSSIITTVGAFVVNMLGNIYAHKMKGSAFTVSVTGVLFLVPSGLSSAGGLADNYRGSTTDYFTASLQVALRMIQVGIGITVGLLVSGMIWHFIRGKNGKGKAVFVF